MCSDAVTSSNVLQQYIDPFLRLMSFSLYFLKTYIVNVLQKKLSLISSSFRDIFVTVQNNQAQRFREILYCYCICMIVYNKQEDNVQVHAIRKTHIV